MSLALIAKLYTPITDEDNCTDNNEDKKVNCSEGPGTINIKLSTETDDGNCLEANFQEKNRCNTDSGVTKKALPARRRRKRAKGNGKKPHSSGFSSARVTRGTAQASLESLEKEDEPKNESTSVTLGEKAPCTIKSKIFRCPYCLVKCENSNQFIDHLNVHGKFVKTKKLFKEEESPEVKEVALELAPPDLTRKISTSRTRRGRKPKPIEVRPGGKQKSSTNKSKKCFIWKSGKGKSRKCPVCHKAFYVLQALDIHMRIHTGEKPYKCTMCPAKFSQNGSLGRHFRLHTGEMPYQCTVCSRRFRNISNMRTHLRTHTGETPFGCKHCPQKFAYSQSRNIHERTHRPLE